MNNIEADKWLASILVDIGKPEHSDLWHYEQALTEIKNMLESAQPERKTGWWIGMGVNADKTYNIVCSKCGEGYKTRGHANSTSTRKKWKFCPNCGADMRGEE